MMAENLIALAVILSFAAYFNNSVKLVDEINDRIMLDRLTLRRAILKLSLFKKAIFVFCLPVILPVGLMIYVVNLILYRNVR